MNLRQLETLCEVVDHGLSLSDAAITTCRSQPSVTRQIQELEKELGVDILRRKRNRVLSLTPQGASIVAMARRMLQEARNMQRVAQDTEQKPAGDFTIATTHTQARYTLPRTIRRFMARYPDVKLILRQGSPGQCRDFAARGHVDLAICAEMQRPPDDVLQIPCYRLSRSVITAARHPLLKIKPLTLEAISRYPVITYDESFSGRWVVDKAFSDKGLKPTVVMSAVDADVSKAYVQMGLGIAILATVAFNSKSDINLRRVDAKHLFEASTLSLVMRRDAYLRTYMLDFMQMFAPHVNTSSIRDALSDRDARATRNIELPEL